MVYNKTLFRRAGVGVPTTLEDLLAACDKLKASGFEPIAFGNQFGWPAIHFVTQLNAYDVPAATLTADYDPKGGAFADPGYVTALRQFSDIVSRCASTDANGVSHEAAQASFLAGKAAMQYVESVEFGVFTERAVRRPRSRTPGTSSGCPRRGTPPATRRPSPARRTASW